MLAQLTAYKYDQLNRLMQIKEVTRSVGCYKYNLKFEYDPMGNRIAKHVFNNNDEKLYSEYYVRDAQGNIISVYKLSIDESEQLASFAQAELHIYGSSMLGMYKPETELISSIPQGNIYTNYLGKKHFTGSNHLGNTIAVFSDIKHQSDYNNDNIVDNYTADLLAANDYAPFGGLLTERTFNKGTFPNTFNGKRDDPELFDWQDYGMMMYSPWTRRFPTVDPIAKDYPWYTPYQFAGNKPIVAIDLDGLEDVWTHKFTSIQDGKTNILTPKTYIDVTKNTSGIALSQMARHLGFTGKIPQTGTIITDVVFDYDNNTAYWNYIFYETPIVKPPSTQEKTADVARATGEGLNFAGSVVAGVGVATVVTPAVVAAPGLITAGLTMSTLGDLFNISANIIEQEYDESAIRIASVVVEEFVNFGMRKILPPEINKQVTQYAVEVGVTIISDSALENNKKDNISYIKGSGSKKLFE